MTLENRRSRSRFLTRLRPNSATNPSLDGRKLAANQIQLVNLVIDYLTQAGWMSAAQLYETPFTDYSPKGVDGVFDPAEVTQLLGILNGIRMSAEEPRV